MKNLKTLALCFCAAFSITAANAAPIQWAGNGNYYDVILDPALTWFEARDEAAAMSFGGATGHLATLTTAAEQSWFITAFGGGVAVDLLWVGGYQDTGAGDYSEPGGGWRWITGEAWNTGPDAPAFSFNNNYWFIHSEEHLITWWQDGGLNDYWYAPNPADRPNPNDAPFARGYIVEFAGTVPAPGALALLGLGLMGLGVSRRSLAVRHPLSR